MIRRSDEYVKDVRQIGGGVGELELRKRYTQEELFGKCRLCTEILLQPGQTIGRHAHDGEFEIFYVLEGELVSVNEDDSEEPFRVGDMMVTGGGAAHALRNDSNALARMLAIIVNG